MVRVRSQSPDGIYYLVNGWRKHKAFWVGEKYKDNAICQFKSVASAKASLTKLLKVMDDYATDIFVFELN